MTPQELYMLHKLRKELKETKEILAEAYNDIDEANKRADDWEDQASNWEEQANNYRYELYDSGDYGYCYDCDRRDCDCCDSVEVVRCYDCCFLVQDGTVCSMLGKPLDKMVNSQGLVIDYCSLGR